MSTSAIDHSLISKKGKHSEHCTFGIVSHNSNNSTFAHFTNHRFRIVTEWVVDVILLQVGLKCTSMRMSLDLLHEFANTEVFCFFHNCMWQSRHSEVNVYFLALSEQTDGLKTFNRSTLFLFDLRLRFRLRLCLDLNFQQILEHNC